eukprot:TRINITY_DN3612_c0_g1_i2.p1 TRINITY_DN3612_c0_g1~~TRINITY_DN3612_c0_g1_i2.p1  ORF type:complete len:160 (-),score=34.53 TRINITY_DN3612_c0_g1_i2:191-670(-)
MELWEAAERGDFSRVEGLISSKKYDINKANWSNETALTFAISGAQNINIVEYLIDAGANVNHANATGATPLILAAEKGNFSIVQYLLSHDANVNASDNEGRTALHYASIKSNEHIVHYLIKNGANIFAQDKKGKSPLDLAREPIIKEILTEAKKNRGGR